MGGAGLADGVEVRGPAGGAKMEGLAAEAPRIGTRAGDFEEMCMVGEVEYAGIYFYKHF